ncbi:hypothetical protein CLAFUW4_13009 [Fulvia fulva]|uniref:Mediator of RNA polymerase II transcription subunit 9 n=1 Tax=Passalora fulva TaxID=5499 RepID=A0A9Q8UV77_PASFU|nr:uncharacterized protein CLAFUR5_12870 [Fulvia fulva]KAK4611907.1 hypothetical protein CLAFUR4_13013 [Fulvia fulva]KAK4612432.1 hypothetical protein CLAFUR0_13017 [Fulvia fulva]UJO23709.1 hypothetical protein CLAFUR5_12870 [Fulvia fulva]WPV21126.1 hypothetical protein CLAFUW4_13009 [Fulvia fulva]WPV35938.1 hypothetical protein CLAFUW7_13016 [Fulvia fulva]
MALKQPIKTTSNTTAPSQSTTLQLPPPQTFELLPPLHELLARIEVYNNQQSTSLDQLFAPEESTDIGSNYAEIQPLNPKDLPTAALDIKSRVRGAQREVEKLPDIDRTVEEQDEEIRELEEKIAKQHAMLSRLGEVAKGLAEKVT